MCVFVCVCVCVCVNTAILLTWSCYYFTDKHWLRFHTPNVFIHIIVNVLIQIHGLSPYLELEG